LHDQSNLVRRPYNRIQQWDWCKVAEGMDVGGNLRAFKASFVVLGLRNGKPAAAKGPTATAGKPASFPARCAGVPDETVSPRRTLPVC